MDQIAILEPFGRGFEKPVFEIAGKIADLKIIGDSRNHLKILLNPEGQNEAIDTVWFNFRENEHDAVPIQTGDIVNCAGTLEINEWRGRRNIQLIISAYCVPQ